MVMGPQMGKTIFLLIPTKTPIQMVTELAIILIPTMIMMGFPIRMN